MMKFTIVGIGPGSSDYITPAAVKAVEKSQIVIGGERNLKSFSCTEKETIIIGSDLNAIAEYIRKTMETKAIAVLVSGDPGFYSMAGFLKKHFTSSEFDIIPAISPVQYLFAKAGLTWEDACLTSLHGRGGDDAVADAVKSNAKTAFLTDNTYTFQRIASILSGKGLGGRMMHVGSNLSYEDEKIFSGTAEALQYNKENLKLSVVIVTGENND